MVPKTGIPERGFRSRRRAKGPEARPLRGRVRAARRTCYDCSMAETTTSTRRKSSGAKEKDFVTRLADAGEEALQRLSDLPGGQRAVTAFNDLRNRVDELTSRSGCKSSRRRSRR
jgi:hypothetical protein